MPKSKTLVFVFCAPETLTKISSSFLLQTTMPSKFPTRIENPPSESESESESSADESESASDSDSAAQNQNQNHAPALDVKPFSPKPMFQFSKTPVRRRLEMDHHHQKKRLWTDKDEIVILKGMIRFRKKGKDPSSQVTEFFDSIKHLLGPHSQDVNKHQLYSKIRTIKRRYLNALKKAEDDLEFTGPHHNKVYQLSKKVWSNKDDDDGHEKCKSVSEGIAASSAKPKSTTLPDNSPHSENACEYKFLNASLLPRDLPVAAPGLGDFFQKKGWNLIGSSIAARCDRQWKNVMIAETKAYLQRIDLIREQTRAMLDALESTDL